ncbi:Uncharacterised protein [Candidatus Norongarragalina meridionalis]|nr:Uncharacterised protein [Candidatus Norongarragalina meridionalis]
MRVAVVVTSEALDEAAKALVEGVSAAGEQAERAEEPGDYELVFLGFETKPLKKDARLEALVERADWNGRKVALFCVHSGKAKRDETERVVSRLAEKGARVVNTMNLEKSGGLLGMGGKLGEQEIFRARGFGERTVRNVKGSRVPAGTEKRDRIKGYAKK